MYEIIKVQSATVPSLHTVNTSSSCLCLLSNYIYVFTILASKSTYLLRFEDYGHKLRLFHANQCHNILGSPLPVPLVQNDFMRKPLIISCSF